MGIRAGLRHILGIALAISVVAAVLAATARTADAQARPNVRADKRDITVLIGGQMIVDGFWQDAFYRDDGGGQRGYQFASIYFRLDIDFRFSEDGGVFASIATRRDETTSTFGTTFPRTRGTIVDNEQPDIVLEELFGQITRLFNIDLQVRVGIQHFKLGLDTEQEKIWEGHGSLWFDTRNGRGPAAFDRMHPIAVTGRWQATQQLWVDGFGAYLNRDLSADENTVWFAGVEAGLLINTTTEESTAQEAITILLGFANWFDQNGPDLRVIWVAARLYATAEVMLYGEAAFQFGNDQSGEGFYGGVRYRFADGSTFVDVSVWHLTGDDPNTSGNEGFISYGSIRTTIGVDSVDFGMGRHTNVTALKTVVGFLLSYNLRLHLVYARYSAENSATSGRPGDEIDGFLIYQAMQHLEARLGVAYLFSSRLRGSDPANPDGWMYIFSLKGDF